MKNIFGKFFRRLNVQIFNIVLLACLVPLQVVICYGIYKYPSTCVAAESAEMMTHMQALGTSVVTSGYLSDLSKEFVNADIDSMSDLYSGRVIIIDKSLTIVKDSIGIDNGKTVVWENVLKTIAGQSCTYYDRENGYIMVTIPLVDSSTGENVGVLLTTKSVGYIEKNRERLVTELIVFDVVILIIMSLISFALSYRYKKYFRDLSDQVFNVEAGIENEVYFVPSFKELEDLQIQYNGLIDRLKSIDESRQEFVSNVSHELKTPLTSMKVLADSLQGQDCPVELYQEFMEDISAEIERETKIINDLLSLVKMDKTSLKLNVEPVNMNDLVESLMKRLKPIAEKSKIELVYESIRPVVAEVDEIKISLAINNLIENAIKYNNEGGWVHVSLDGDHEDCILRVEDNGLGIPEEALDHIFERFYRVDKSHSREIGGTGLGLAITKQSIVSHYGDIRVHSTEGEGTLFEVKIPLSYIVREEE